MCSRHTHESSGCIDASLGCIHPALVPLWAHIPSRRRASASSCGTSISLEIVEPGSKAAPCACHSRSVAPLSLHPVVLKGRLGLPGVKNELFQNRLPCSFHQGRGRGLAGGR